ncbi:MAG: type II restriction endonuclease [Gemmatimonadetes bacterium]|nr:type II restriction endonuclease [Gemmatimonadota bacterium]
MDPRRTLIEHWRSDAGGSYQRWFLWEERLKNFRSIRRGLSVVVEDIRADRFGRQYRGSSLETVVKSVAEQRQVFRGADHAFLWKPKLRIPDIYENRENQLAFADLLHSCACCDTETEVLGAIHRLNAKCIKGLGPAAANLLYFLHPTIAPPSNTAIARGYERMTGVRVPLGQWPAYLAMREGMVRLTAEFRDLLSNDLGAIAGFLYDMGCDRYPAPPRDPMTATDAMLTWRQSLDAAVAAASAAGAPADASDDLTHTEVQSWLRDLGRALGFDVWIASNDRGRRFGDGLLGDGCMTELPARLRDGPGAEAIRLIDVLWLDRSTRNVCAAFEVEHTTSIYSGIVRLLDLALGAGSGSAHGLFLVAPDTREADVRAQLARPAFQRIGDLAVRFIPYGALAKHRGAIAQFGSSLKAIEAIAVPL